MRTLYQEFRDLLEGPEVLAVGIIGLVLGAGDFVRLHLVWDPGVFRDRLWQIAAVAHLDELLVELDLALPWLR